MTDDQVPRDGRPPLPIRRMLEEMLNDAWGIDRDRGGETRILAFVGSIPAQRAARKEIEAPTFQAKAARETFVCKMSLPERATGRAFLDALAHGANATPTGAETMADTMHRVRDRINGRPFLLVVENAGELFGRPTGGVDLVSLLGNVGSIPRTAIALFGDRGLLRIREHPQLDRRARILMLDTTEVKPG